MLLDNDSVKRLSALSNSLKVIKNNRINLIQLEQNIRNSLMLENDDDDVNRLALSSLIELKNLLDDGYLDFDACGGDGCGGGGGEQENSSNNSNSLDSIGDDLKKIIDVILDATQSISNSSFD